MMAKAADGTVRDVRLEGARLLLGEVSLRHGIIDRLRSGAGDRALQSFWAHLEIARQVIDEAGAVVLSRRVGGRRSGDVGAARGSGEGGGGGVAAGSQHGGRIGGGYHYPNGSQSAQQQ